MIATLATKDWPAYQAMEGFDKGHGTLPIGATCSHVVARVGFFDMRAWLCEGNLFFLANLVWSTSRRPPLAPNQRAPAIGIPKTA